MAIPTSPVDRNLPKGPNFLGIVIGSAIAIIVILAVAWLLVRHTGWHIFPVNTKATPSQTYLRPTAVPPGVTAA